MLTDLPVDQGFYFDGELLGYKLSTNLAGSFGVLGDVAFQTVLSLTSFRIAELARVYKDNHFDLIRILELVDSIIDCSINTDLDLNLDIDFDRGSEKFKENLAKVIDITVRHRHPDLQDMNSNHISFLFKSCVNKKSDGELGLGICRLVKEEGRVVADNGEVFLNKRALLEIRDITKGLISEAIKAVEMHKVGTCDRDSEQYKAALASYTPMHDILFKDERQQSSAQLTDQADVGIQVAPETLLSRTSPENSPRADSTNPFTSTIRRLSESSANSNGLAFE